MKSELVPLNGDPPIPISRDVTLIGRREFCDAVVAHPSLSKRHCVLVRTDGLLIVRDLISTNGTKVNGQRVVWAALLPNDRLTVGRYKFKVYLGPDDALSPSEQRRRGVTEYSGAGVSADGAVMAGDSLDAGKAGGPRAPTGFAAPSPLSIPAFVNQTPPHPGSDNPDSDAEAVEEEGLEIIDDNGEPYIIDLD